VVARAERLVTGRMQRQGKRKLKKQQSQQQYRRELEHPEMPITKWWSVPVEMECYKSMDTKGRYTTVKQQQVHQKQ
jgi:hypothetical protein